jgi:hypothetical protein
MIARAPFIGAISAAGCTGSTSRQLGAACADIDDLLFAIM